MVSLFLWWLVLLIKISGTANFETQCFDTDPLKYCSELDTSVTIRSLINEMKYFNKRYTFLPYGVIYNVSIINSTSDNIISSIYIIGINKLTTTSQLQWDISTFFMDLFLNMTTNKNVFVDTEYDGLPFGLRIYNYTMSNDAAKYFHYINEIYDKASSPIQDINTFLQLINSNSLSHKFTMASYFTLTLWNAMSSEIQKTIHSYIELFNYTNYKYNINMNSLETAETYWDQWVDEQIINRDKLYKQQYQTLFQKYFDLMDSLLTYAYWYQDSNLYDTIFRWKQKSYYIFQNWLYKSYCKQIERDNYWIEGLTDSVLNKCNLKSNDNKCYNILIIELYNIERVIDKLERNINDVLNTNKIKFDVHRISVDWLNHVDLQRDSEAIVGAVKETVKSFTEDLEVFVSWQDKA